MIPFECQLLVAPVHGFYVYDERVVHVEHLTAELKLSQPSEVATYVRFFSLLAAAARYGADARVLITRALAELMATS